MNPSRETKFSGAKGDREKVVFSVQLTTNRINDLTRLVLTLMYAMTIHTYIHPVHVCACSVCFIVTSASLCSYMKLYHHIRQ